MTTALGKLLAAARDKKQWTLRQVEEQTGIRNAHLSQIEKGIIKQPKADVLWRLADLYGLDYSKLLRAAGHTKQKTHGDPLIGAAFRASAEMTEDEQQDVIAYMNKILRQRGE